MCWMMNAAAVFTSWLVWTTLSATILVGLIFLVRWTAGSWLTPKWRYGLWLLLLLKLLIPWNPESVISVFNLTPGSVRKTLSIAENPESFPTYDKPVSFAPERGEMPLVVVPDQSSERRVTASHTPLSNSPVPSFDENIARSPSSPSLSAAGRRRKWDWRAVVALTWLAGFLILGCKSIISSLLAAKRLVGLESTSDPELNEILDQARKLVGIERTVRIVETDMVRSPALAGLFHPVVLIPTGMLDHFSREEMTRMLVHELCHLKRRDLWTGALVGLATRIHWFNPFVHVGFRQMILDREIACDELAVAKLKNDDPRSYGGTLLKMLERLQKPEKEIKPVNLGSVSVLERSGHISQRIRTLAAEVKFVKLRVALSVAVLLTLAGATLTSARTRNATVDGEGETRASYVALAKKSTPPETETTPSQSREIDVENGLDANGRKTNKEARKIENEHEFVKFKVIDKDTGKPVGGQLGVILYEIPRQVTKGKRGNMPKRGEATTEDKAGEVYPMTIGGFKCVKRVSTEKVKFYRVDEDDGAYFIPKRDLENIKSVSIDRVKSYCLDEKRPISVSDLDNMVVKLEKGATLGGTVIDEKEKPAVNAVVSLSLEVKRSPSLSYMDNVSGTVGVNGIYDLYEGLRPGRWNLSIRKGKDAYHCGDLVVDGRKPIRLNIKLSKRSGMLTGRFITEDGTGVKGEILLLSASKPVVGEDVVALKSKRYSDFVNGCSYAFATDDDGSFKIKDVPPGKFNLKFMGNGYAAYHQKGIPITVKRPIVNLGDITLPDAGQIRGTIKDQFGNPVANHQIYFKPQDTPFGWEGIYYNNFKTDENGQFHIKGLTEKFYLIQTRLPRLYNHMKKKKSEDKYLNASKVVLVNSENVEFTLRPARYKSLMGRVLNAKTNKPVASAKVKVIYANDIRFKYGRPSKTEIVADKDGRFTVPLKENASESYAFFKISAPGYIDLTSPSFTIKDSSTEERTFRMNEGGEVSGKVVDVKGSPVCNAFLQGIEAGDYSSTKHCTSADDGRFKFEGVPPGSFEIKIDYPEAKTVTIDVGETGKKDVVIVLGEDTGIKGRVLWENGKPVVKGNVQISPYPYVMTDSNGKFILKGVAKRNHYWISVSIGFPPRDLSCMSSSVASMETIFTKVFKLSKKEISGGDLILTIPESKRDATFKMVFLPEMKSRPLQYASMDANCPKGIHVSSVDRKMVNNAFAFSNLYPGKYGFSANILNNLSFQQNLNIHEGENESSVKCFGEISGFCVDTDGKRLEEAKIYLKGRGESLQGTSYQLSGSIPLVGNGEILLSSIPAGDYQIRIVPPDAAPVALAFTITDQQPKVTLGEIIIDKGIAVKGRALTEDGRPVPGAEVCVIAGAPFDGNEDFNHIRMASGRNTMTDKEGRFSINNVSKGENTLWIAKREGVNPLSSSFEYGPYAKHVKSTKEDLGDFVLSKQGR